MKLTENEPKERTFTLELSETELRTVVVATELADLAETSDRTRLSRDTVSRILDSISDAARLLGVKL